MDFNVDKRRVSEGDVVEVRWACPNGQSTRITINNGFKSSSAEVENSGSKKFRLNRSNGHTVISIESVVNGKTVTKSRKVRVVTPKKSKTQGKQYDSYENLSSHPLREKFNAWKSRMKYAWKAMPPQKQQATIVILLICAIMMAASFYPPIIYFGLCAISIYLLWTLFRR